MPKCKQCNQEFKLGKNVTKMYCSYECSKKYWAIKRGINKANEIKVWDSQYFDWRDYPNGII